MPLDCESNDKWKQLIKDNNKYVYEHGDKQGNVMDEWEPVAKYAPEFADTDLDIPQEVVDQDYFFFSRIVWKVMQYCRTCCWHIK